MKKEDRLITQQKA